MFSRESVQIYSFLKCDILDKDNLWTRWNVGNVRKYKRSPTKPHCCWNCYRSNKWFASLSKRIFSTSLTKSRKSLSVKMILSGNNDLRYHLNGFQVWHGLKGVWRVIKSIDRSMKEKGIVVFSLLFVALWVFDSQLKTVILEGLSMVACMHPLLMASLRIPIIAMEFE